MSIAPRTQQQILDDLLQQQLGPYPQAGAAASALTASSLHAQITAMLGMTLDLTKEEEAELEDLKVQYEHALKRSKLDTFKKLDPELRQFVVNCLNWQEATQNMKATPVVKSARQVELENKDINRRTYGQPTSRFGASSSAMTLDGLMQQLIRGWIQMPEGVTADDLKQAHMEATLEEEMLNVQP